MWMFSIIMETKLCMSVRNEQWWWNASAAVDKSLFLLSSGTQTHIYIGVCTLLLAVICPFHGHKYNSVCPHSHNMYSIIALLSLSLPHETLICGGILCSLVCLCQYRIVLERMWNRTHAHHDSKVAFRRIPILAVVLRVYAVCLRIWFICSEAAAATLNQRKVQQQMAHKKNSNVWGEKNENKNAIHVGLMYLNVMSMQIKYTYQGVDTSLT